MLRWILISLVTAGVLALIARYFARRKLGKGATVHRLNPPAWVVWGAMFGAIGLTGFGLVLSFFEGPARWIVLTVMVVYAAGVALFFWYGFLAYFVWTTDGFGTWDPLRKHRFIRWADSRGITASRIPLHREVRDGADIIVFPAILDGLAELDAFLQRRGAPVPIRHSP
jgi:hypothetical protein